VITGTAFGAGTDSSVYITLHGENGSSSETLLDTGGNNFENGQTDVFHIVARDLGNLQRVTIRHDDKGIGSGWLLDRVVVHNEKTGLEWIFPCGRWLARNEDDGQISRALTPI
jgi:PLAT/LH2 domain